MEFSRQGLEELFSDGVVNPAAMSGPYLKNCTKFSELESRVFLLYEPDSALHPSGADFDIVLLHGIGSDEFTCWTNAQGIVWPAVFLPQDFPTARVVTVGYAHSLFNWKADEGEAVETAAEVSPTSTAAPSMASPEDGGPAGAERGALGHIQFLAGKVGRSAKEAVSTYAPKDATDWWVGSASAKGTNEQNSNQVSTKEAVDTTTEEKREVNSQASERAAQQEADNPLFQLLTRIRDSTGSLVAAEDEASAASLSGSAPATDGAAQDKDRKTSRDVRSLQNMRIVAAELAERLGSSKVGVGQRPVVFLVHSMGGLILKQMLISLFEAARLAPPSAAALSLAAEAAADGPAAEETALSRNCAAVQKANVLLRAVRGVVFYGTPHFGSAVASVITGLQKYYQGLGGLTPTSVVTGLGDHNKQELLRLNDRFFDVVERIGTELSVETPGSAAPASQSDVEMKSYVAAMKASLAPVQNVWNAGVGSRGIGDCGGGGSDTGRGTVWILSFGETKKLNGLVRVVDPESANPAPDDPRYPFYLVNADHGEVCRPLTKMSPSYAMVYGMLDRMQQRGLLKWPRERSFLETPQSGDVRAFLPSSASSAAGTSTTQHMCERYEKGWSALFDPAGPPSTTPIHDAAHPGPPKMSSAESPPQASESEQRNFEAFQRGVGEMRVALPMLEEALNELHHLLHRFFGVAVPPQLDSIFLLAADVTDFVTRFYRREAMIVEGIDDGKGGTESVAVREGFSEGSVLIDEVVSFRIPLQLLTYWVQQATSLLRVFELSQHERSIGVSAVGGASPTAARWESDLSTHPGGRDLRELSELEQSVGVVREEWEAFRRYVSMRIRAVSPANVTQRRSPKARSGSPLQEGPIRPGSPAEVAVREHIAALFFARAIRTIVSQHLLDGGALGGLLGAYLRSAILQIRGSEKQLSSTTFQRSPWALLDRDPDADSAAVVALVMEGLELSIAESPAAEATSVLMDTSASNASLNSAVELGAIVPALTATSATLLGCFALFVDELHLLDSGARCSRAAAHFQLSALALRADFHVRSRLLRVASRTMQEEGLVSPPPGDGKKKTSSAEKEWWRSAWDMTASKPATNDARGAAATGGAAGALADGRQRHVAKLDDGLFLSAMQLMSASFQSAILVQSYHDRRALFTVGAAERSTVLGACPPGQHDTELSAEEEEGVQGTPTDSTVDALLESTEAAQRACDRTAKMLRGVSVLSDAEKPFASPEDESRSLAAESTAGTGEHREKSRRDCLRDAVESLLSELDQDEGEESNTSENTRVEGGGSSKKTASLPSLSWTSRPSAAAKKKSASEKVTNAVSTTQREAVLSPKVKNRKSSLPMLIINSLSKAWDAVRSGGAEVETPEHFAHTALVMWWMVEGETIAVFRDASGTLRSPSASAQRTKILNLVGKMEAALSRRSEATATRHTGPASPKVSATSARPPALLSKDSERTREWERRCWWNANAATQCKWMTLRGGEEFLRKFRQDLRAERETLEKIVASTSPSQLRASEESFGPPATLLRLDGEGEAQLGIPSSLLDAVQHDDTSAALRCWLGHCYAVHRVRSPDTAHAYLQVIRNDYAAHKRYTPTAEVGLAWNHLHNIPCSFAQLWRLSEGAKHLARNTSSSGSAEKQSSSRDGTNARTAAALLGFGSTGVVDTFALHSVPPPLLHFCNGAVRHHTNAVHEFLEVDDTPPSATSSVHNRKVSQAGALLQALSLQSPPANAESLRHLRLAEAGFQRALSVDPENIGALCGLGRLRCLSLSSPPPGGGAHGSFSPNSSALSACSPYSHATPVAAPRRAGGASSGKAAGFFRAALNAGEHTLLLSDADSSPRLPSTESCAHVLDCVWLSYAAYWMSEESRRACVTASNTSTQSRETEAAAEATEWLVRSLHYYPRNDWALTSLGLSNLVAGFTPPPSPHPAGGLGGVSRASSDNDSSVALSHLRGLALLQRALAVNPNNMWALWGMGTYGTSPAHRSICQSLLRRLVLQRIPRL